MTTELPSTYEHRRSKTPTADRVLELLDRLARTIVSHRNQLFAVQQPILSPLQHQILQLLDIPQAPTGRPEHTHEIRVEGLPRHAERRLWQSP